MCTSEEVGSVHFCFVAVAASLLRLSYLESKTLMQAYFGDNRKWMEGVKSVLPKLFAEDRTALRSEEWEQRIRTITTVLDLRTSRAFQRMHYIWRPRMWCRFSFSLRTVQYPCRSCAHSLVIPSLSMLLILNIGMVLSFLFALRKVQCICRS